MTCRHCHTDKHPQRTNRKSLNDYKIQLKTKKQQVMKERLKCTFVNTKDAKRSCRPAKSFATIEALATHCERAHKMTPNRVTETVRSTDTITEHNTKQKPKVRFRINDNTEIPRIDNSIETNNNTNNAQSNNTIPVQLRITAKNTQSQRKLNMSNHYHTCYSYARPFIIYV